MTRQIELSRDEAELIVDLLALMPVDNEIAADLATVIRSEFGMVPFEREWAGITRAEAVQEIKRRHGV